MPYSYLDRATELWTEFYRSRLIAFGKWHHLDQCPYCNSSVQKTYVTNGEIEETLFEQKNVRKCCNCGWWDFEEELPVEKDHEGSYSSRSIHRRAVLREFSIAGIDAPIVSLRKHITRHPNAIYSMNPKRLEELVGSVFGDFMNCEAIHVGGANDKGIDVVLVTGERQYVVQVKRRSSDNATEAVSGIREFLGAMVLNNFLKGIFVTTAKRFSKQATMAAHRARDIGAVEYIKLVNSDKLIDVCKMAASHIDPPEKKYMTSMEQLSKHLEPGFNAFMTLFMGHPDWKVSEADELH